MYVPTDALKKGPFFLAHRKAAEYAPGGTSEDKEKKKEVEIQLLIL